jgi:pilus assembly protein CpaC
MSPRSSRLIGLVGVLAAVLAAIAPAQALAQNLAGGMGGELRVNLAGQGETGQSISIPRGKSAIVDLPVDARDVLVTDPKVADTVLRSPRKIYVMGLAPGQTDAVFFDAAGRRILALNIRVDQDFSAVADTISRIIPGSHVQVEAINNSVVLSGSVANQSEADRALQIAQQFTTKPEQVLNMISVAGKDQVMLKVRIVEVQRSVIKQLGFNLSATLGQLGSPQFALASAAQYAVNGSLLGGITSGYSLDTTQQPELQVPCATGLSGTCEQIVRNTSSTYPNGNTATTQTTAGSNGLNKGAASIQAFEQVGLVRTLAEPTLTTVSGEAAKFLAGGEFPVPTGEDTTGKISIEFKPYGVGLGFTPVVLSNGRISLKISTEVSELTNQGSFNLATSSTTSLTIPGLNVRRAETVVELPSGGAMMIAGLLKEETKQDIDSLPGLMNLPVLGALFRSRDYQEGETELVVIVTPYLVQPTNPNNLQTPADGLKIASDAETILLGHINSAYHAPPAAAAAAQANYQGPVGYVIE